MKIDKSKIVPLTLTAVIILADQLIKGYIVKHWPVGTMIRDVFGNGFLQIWHVRNPDIAFSLGRNIPAAFKMALFIVLPLLVLGFLFWYYIRSAEFSRAQRWAAAGIFGGGIGNLIDRIFRRPEGVVDFISVKLYGFLGFDRWPTFNVADSSVVVCCIVLFITILFSAKSKTAGAAADAGGKKSQGKAHHEQKS